MSDLPAKALGFRVQEYGMIKWRDLFTPRQLVALTTFSDLVTEARARVERDAIVAGLPDDSTPLRDGGTGATAYAEAVAVYLAFAYQDKMTGNSHGPQSKLAMGNPRQTRATFLDDKLFQWSGIMPKQILPQFDPPATGKALAWKLPDCCVRGLSIVYPMKGTWDGSNQADAQHRLNRAERVRFHRPAVLRQHRLR